MVGTGEFRAQRVITPSGCEAWTLLGVDSREIDPARQFLKALFNQERSPNTLRAYAYDLKHFFTFLAERDLDWRAVTPADIGEFVAWMRRPAGNVVLLPDAAPARHATTVNRALSAVTSFYEHHHLEGVDLAERLKDSLRSGRRRFRPFLHGVARYESRARRGRLRTVSRQPRSLSVEQVAHIVHAQQRLRDRFLFVLMFETGMRVGQCLGLRHEDVRIWKREIRIEPRVDNANGARGKRGIGTAFISQRAAQLYLLYMDCEYGPIDSDYVFVNLWGGEVGGALTYRSVYDLVTRTRRRVGFHFTPHQLRHTFVTRARRHGVSLEVVSKLVTHQCVSTTADIYSHLDPEDLRREIEAAGLWNDLEGAA